MSKRFGIFTLWSIATLLIGGLLAWLIAHNHFRVQTDFLALLPATVHSTEVSLALNKIETDASRQFTFYIQGNTPKEVTSAAERIAKLLSESTAVHSVAFTRDNQQASFLTPLLQARYFLLNDDAIRAITNEPNNVVESAIKRLYRPIASNPIASFDQDPFGFFTRYIENLPKPNSSANDPIWLNGVPYFEKHSQIKTQPSINNAALKQPTLNSSPNQRYYVPVYAQLSGPPFSIQLQESFSKTLQAIENARSSIPNIEIIHSGAIFHITQATQQAKQEMSTIGIGSLLGIVLLLALSFRSAKPILLSIAAIATGCLWASVITIILFGEIHLLTLVFGASLTGMSIDYSFHYFATPSKDAKGLDRLRHVLPGITIGLVTSVIAFLCLLLPPFPGLQQMAVFASIGLASAYFCVLCWYPVLTGSLPTVSPWLIRKCHQLALWPSYILGWLTTGKLKQNSADKSVNLNSQKKHLSLKVMLVVIGVCISVGSVLGWVSLKADDNIKVLYQAPEHLAKMEQQAQQLSTNRLEFRFFLLEASSPEELTTLESAFQKSLNQAVAQNWLGDYWSLGRYIPPTERQLYNYNVLANNVYNDNGLITQLAAALELDQSWVDAQQAIFIKAATANIRFDELAKDHPDTYGKFWTGGIPISGNTLKNQAITADKVSAMAYYSVVALSDIKNPEKLKNLAQAKLQSATNQHNEAANSITKKASAKTHNTNSGKIYWIDRVGMTSATFSKYLNLSLVYTALAYGLILLLLILRYRLIIALKVFAAPFFAAVFTLAILGWFNVNVNLFTAFALIVVLGVGIDYAVFFQEAVRPENKLNSNTLVKNNTSGNQLKHDSRQASRPAKPSRHESVAASKPHSAVAYTMLAVTLSASTTILAFGLLGLSQTPALYSFGITLWIGITFAFLLAPLFSVKRQNAR